VHPENGAGKFKKVQLHLKSIGFREIQERASILHAHGGAQWQQYLFKVVKKLQCASALPRIN